MRIVSGARPTGSLHLGNYAGAVSNWLKLQQEHECFFFIADYHALTTGFRDTSLLSEHTAVLLAEYLAIGIDPEKAVLFVQSDVPDVAELTLLLSMVTPLSWLERNPTYKDQLNELDGEPSEIRSSGFLNYPTLMAADILMYYAEAVPVARDQLPHLELAREIARRSNHLYGTDFIEPKALLVSQALLRGTDGRKMSKSYGNTISFADTPDEVTAKIRQMVTDPARIRRDDPGHPDVCSVYDLHLTFNKEEAEEIGENCRAGSIGCVDCKRNCAEVVRAFHSPIHEERQRLLSDRAYLRGVASRGAEKAGAVAAETMQKVSDAVGLGL